MQHSDLDIDPGTSTATKISPLWIMSLFWLVFLFDEHDFSTCTRDVLFFQKVYSTWVLKENSFRKIGCMEFFVGKGNALPETNISPEKAVLKMIFLFQRWDMLIPWRVYHFSIQGQLQSFHHFNWPSSHLPALRTSGFLFPRFFSVWKRVFLPQAYQNHQKISFWTVPLKRFHQRKSSIPFYLLPFLNMYFLFFFDRRSVNHDFEPFFVGSCGWTKHPCKRIYTHEK